MFRRVRAYAGDGEAGAGGDDGAGPEADQQLVHQPAEAALEADVGGHAVRDDGGGGRVPCPAGRRGGAVRGEQDAVHGGRRHAPAGVVTAGLVSIAPTTRNMHVRIGRANRWCWGFAVEWGIHAWRWQGKKPEAARGTCCLIRSK
jgi:hypothetical protein